MAERSVVIRLLANVTGLTAGLATGAAAVKGFSSGLMDNARKNEQAFNTVGLAAAGMGLAIGAGVVAAVSSFANFDQAMSNVQAATHETAAGMDVLRDAAMQAGADTAFSAVEAAAGIEELAKAGVSTVDIIGGGLAGALDLAAAGGISVAEAAETTATALSVFNLNGSEASHVADLLAAGAGKAQGSVSDMGAALNQSALVANQMGLSIEETAGSLALFASNGLIGSDAGTSFRAMLIRLANPTKEASDQMSALGINVYDAQGQFVGMEALAGQLQTQMSGLDQETRNAALATIFGSDAIRAASILYEDGAAGVATWTANVDDAGYAAETAGIRMDNLRGDLEKLSGSLETAMIGLGASADGPLRDLVQNLTELINKFSELSPGAQSAVLATAAVVAGLLGVSAAVLIVLPRIAATITAFSTMGITAAGTATALRGLGAAGLVVGAAFAADWGIDKIDQMLGLQVQTEGLADDLLKLGETGQVSGQLLDVFGEDLAGLQEVLSLSTEGFNGWINSAEGNFKSIERIDQALAAMVESGNAEGAAAAVAELGLSMDQVTERMPVYVEALQTDANASFKETLDGTVAVTDAFIASLSAVPGATEPAASSQEELTAALEAQNEIMGAAVEAWQTLNGIHMSAAESEAAYQQAIDDTSAAIAAQIEAEGGLAVALNETMTGFDLTEQAGRDLQAQIFGTASTAAAAAVTARDLAVATGTDNVVANAAMMDSLSSVRGDLSTTLQSLGINKEAADALALSVIGIPDDALTVVTADTSQAEAAVAAQRARYEDLMVPKLTRLDADASGAMAGAAAAQSAINSVQGRTVYMNVVTQYLSNGTPGPLEGYATGGMVNARPGGRIVRIGEGGEDEAVVPKGRLLDIIMGSYDLGQVAASRAMAPQMVPYRDVPASVGGAAPSVSGADQRQFQLHVHGVDNSTPVDVMHREWRTYADTGSR